MARSRNIKPGFFSNEYLAELEPLARLLFAGLWCLADREGRLEDRPRKIKAEILPYDDCDVDNLLNNLMNANEQFIIRYEAESKDYIQISNFNKHQNPHKNEVPSTIPPLDESARSKIGTSTDKIGTTPADSLNLIPDSLNLIPDSLNLIPDSLNLIPDSSTCASTVQKKPKKPKPEIVKKVFGEKVHLTEPEHQKLVEKNGEQDTEQMISILDNWYLLHGKKPYASDYQTMVTNGWVFKKMNEEKCKQGGKPFKPQHNRPKSFDAIDQWYDMTKGMEGNDSR